MAKSASITIEIAEKLAISALSFMASDPERLGRFLAISGIGPEAIRKAAADPRFLSGVLDHVVSDEPLLLAVAEHIGVPIHHERNIRRQSDKDRRIVERKRCVVDDNILLLHAVA